MHWKFTSVFRWTSHAIQGNAAPEAEESERRMINYAEKELAVETGKLFGDKCLGPSRLNTWFRTDEYASMFNIKVSFLNSACFIRVPNVQRWSMPCNASLWNPIYNLFPFSVTLKSMVLPILYLLLLNSNSDTISQATGLHCDRTCKNNSLPLHFNLSPIYEIQTNPLENEASREEN